MTVSIKKDNGIEVSIQPIKEVQLQLVLDNAYTYVHTRTHTYTQSGLSNLSKNFSLLKTNSKGVSTILTHTDWSNKCMIIGAIFLIISGWYSKNTIFWNEI